MQGAGGAPHNICGVKTLYQGWRRTCGLVAEKQLLKANRAEIPTHNASRTTDSAKLSWNFCYLRDIAAQLPPRERFY